MDQQLNIPKLAIDIAYELGVEYVSLSEYEHSARIFHEPTGFQCSLSSRGYGSQRHKIAARAVSPQTPRGSITVTHLGPEVSFDYHRAPRDIARDLKRRFFAKWLAVWPSVQVRINDETIKYDKCQTLAHDLAVLTMGHVKAYSDQFQVTAHFGDMSWFQMRMTDPRYVHIEIHNASPEQTEAIAAIMAKR